jgi:hemolysin-activating ACP:hemolysin acyltransferase
MHCRVYHDPDLALGVACRYLRTKEPFRSYGFGGHTDLLLGQILRGHFSFIVDGDVIVGYVGWALCSEEVASDWMGGLRLPSYGECQSGDVLAIATFATNSLPAALYAARLLRNKYPFLQRIARRREGGRSPLLSFLRSRHSQHTAPENRVVELALDETVTYP